MEIGREELDPRDEGARLINRFYCRKKRCDLLIWEEADGKRDWGLIPAAHHFKHDLRTIRASAAWGVRQEAAAVQLLGQLLRHHQFKSYLLTGAFMEASPRSKLVYVFRKLRPTVALRFRGDDTHILCCLCMHPIGYYEDSWAGAMTPTDDVIAHLMLMRGDEVMFWRRCNQHRPSRPEAGLG